MSVIRRTWPQAGAEGERWPGTTESFLFCVDLTSFSNADPAAKASPEVVEALTELRECRSRAPGLAERTGAIRTQSPGYWKGEGSLQTWVELPVFEFYGPADRLRHAASTGTDPDGCDWLALYDAVFGRLAAALARYFEEAGRG